MKNIGLILTSIVERLYILEIMGATPDNAWYGMLLISVTNANKIIFWNRYESGVIVY